MVLDVDCQHMELDIHPTEAMDSILMRECLFGLDEAEDLVSAGVEAGLDLAVAAVDGSMVGDGSLCKKVFNSMKTRKINEGGDYNAIWNGSCWLVSFPLFISLLVPAILDSLLDRNEVSILYGRILPLTILANV